jgi:hypothetical protein
MASLTKKQINQICHRISQGRSWRSICGELKDLPPLSTIYDILEADTIFAERYARAKSVQAEHFANEIVDISDDLSDGAHSRAVRIDARKWVASKLLPKRYGDKQQVEQSGPGGGPIQVKFVVED